MRLAVFAFVVAIAACSSETKNADAGKALSISIAVDVPGASEIHKCRFVRVPDDRGGHIAKMSHEYTPGSHHLLLFRTDLTELPESGDALVDCYEKGAGVMSHVRGVLYAQQTPKAEAKLPEGVGLPLTAGAVLLMQAHYINASASPISAKVDLKLTLADESAIKEEAGVLFYYDPFIHVPPGATASALMRCKVPKAIKLLGGLSHMHKRGVGFEAFLDAPSGEMSASSFYKSNDWDHPAALETPIDVAADSRIRFRCDYANVGGDREYLQGQSAETDEMCIFTGLYYPAMAPNEELCMGLADMLGGGSKSCSDSLACVQKCPPGTSPKIAGTGNPSVHPCWQKCFADSCPTASAPLLAQLGCVRNKCAEACTDNTASSCASCVIANCGAEYSACNSHVCQ